MLDPRERQHLMEALRPPEGYELDRALGTTYSLDLFALLTTPLAFTIFEQEESDRVTAADPLALLETMRRYASRISIFCQAGRISVPESRQLLLGYLEDSVFEVTAPREHASFHPKVWALRYLSPEGHVRYRLLCLSRNLTFDRSWDTVLALEGELTGRKNAIGRNHPLGDFFAALPRLSLRPLPKRALGDLDLVQHEIRRVNFQVPEGFEEISFRPLGLRGPPTWPFDGRIDRMLVVSPFVSDGALDRLAKQANASMLVSRLESVDALQRPHREGLDQVYVMNPSAVPEDGEAGAEESSLLSGLHAKLYVADAGWNARVWTGSANATNAAFERNVEFLVELTGKKSQIGIDKLLGINAGNAENEVAGLMSMLQPYSAGEDMPDDTERSRLEALTEDVQRSLAGGRWAAEAVETAAEREVFELKLRLEDRAPAIPAGATVRCWPITLPAVSQKLESLSVELTFSQVSFEALTSFFAFEVTSASDEASVRRVFSINVPLSGQPPNRQERILRALLDSREKVLRLILLLLAETGHDSHEALVAAQRILVNGGSENGSSSTPFPLFEALVRTLERDPARLDQIGKLLADLQSSPEGKDLVPEGLDEVWQPILQARKRMQG